MQTDQMRTKLETFINENLPVKPENLFTDFGSTIGLINILHSDQGKLVPALWGLMPKLDHYLMDLTDSDITELSAECLCNQYDTDGSTYFRFTIRFTYEC